MDLTDKQQQIIRDNASTITDLTELTRLAFPDVEKVDGRSKQGRAVRKFLVENQIDYETKHVYRREEIILTQEQKEFIEQSISDGIECIKIAGILFPNVRMACNTKEYLTVYNYVDSNPNISLPGSEDSFNKSYSPPKAVSKVIKKINDSCQKNLNESKLAMTERKSI